MDECKYVWFVKNIINLNIDVYKNIEISFDQNYKKKLATQEVSCIDIKLQKCWKLSFAFISHVFMIPSDLPKSFS